MSGYSSGEDHGPGKCELCHRSTRISAHHLIPREVHPKYLRKGMSKEELSVCALLCPQCHSMVHKAAPNGELAELWNTVENLQKHPYIEKWLPYIRKQKVRLKLGHKTKRLR
eukprot:Filipodium_phascolosomae@DN3046_c0_g1_i1.p1